jgi:hypothetical protein
MSAKKTPSYLKGLFEDRARAAGEVDRYQRIARDVAEILATSQKALEALDTVIRRFDARLTPEDIKPIRCPKSYGGKRGQRKDTVIQILKAEAPESITTSEICMELQVRFQLTFETAVLRTRWRTNSIGKLMRNLLEEGLIEALHTPDSVIAEGARWRWKSDAVLSSDHLKMLVEAGGGEVQFYDASHE